MIIMFGPAGSGKSTQGQMLAEEFGWKWLSVGQVLRATGEFDAILEQGHLVDDDTVIKLMQYEIEKADADGKNLILDGFPRNAYQAEWVKSHLQSDIEGMITISVPKSELLRRLEERSHIEGRADDSARETIERRWHIYEQEITAILPLLKSCGIPHRDIDGLGTIEEVSARLRQTIIELSPVAELQTADVNGDEAEKSYGE